MTVKVTVEHWQDDGWYVGKIKEIPGIFSQGETLEELKSNLREAYQMMMEEEEKVSRELKVSETELDLDV